ncbi:rubredoxin [Thauera humireducens]
MPDLRFHLRRSRRPARRGHSAGTRWEDVPPNWTCPECQARKEDFELVEI